ncbi:HK97-gp10 family putative phage morphogenesis protein [Morganella morganii]
MNLGEKLTSRILRDAGREAMTVVAEDMKQYAGYDSSHDDDHMRDSIKVRTTDRMKDKKYITLMTVRVGPSKAHHMKAQAQEFGTSKQIPRPFIRPALDYHRKDILNTLAAAIRAGINENR